MCRDDIFEAQLPFRLHLRGWIEYISDRRPRACTRTRYVTVKFKVTKESTFPIFTPESM
jgi:hypothetical protein